jgi:AcrR family transcriptional regulator
MKNTKSPARPVEDRRVRRTRQHLRDALVALILDRGWDRVSVQDVCERADVGRSTFYVHFADKEELLLSGFGEVHAALEAQRVAGLGSFAFAEHLVEHAKDNARLFRALVGRRTGLVVQRRFRDLVMQLVEAELEHLEVPRQHRKTAALYVSGGFVELLTAWLEGPSKEAGALAENFRRLTRGALRAIERM